MRGAPFLAAAAVLSLAACNTAEHSRASGGGGVGGICRPFAKDASAAAATDPSFATDDCLHRWAYTLARAEDTADIVAQAAVAACTAPLGRWNQQTLTSGQTQEAPSLVTGETTNPMAAHAAFAEGRALFYVVQARAGKCEPPRIEKTSTPAQATTPQAATPGVPDR